MQKRWTLSVCCPQDAGLFVVLLLRAAGVIFLVAGLPGLGRRVCEAGSAEGQSGGSEN